MWNTIRRIIRTQREAPPILPAPRDANMPLSFAQERLWVLDQLVVDRSAYHVSNLTRLQGPLRPDLLARSVRQVVRRHETLRTTFVEQDGQPVQIIHPDLACAWTFQDFRHLPQEEREQHARQWAVAELRQPFDLTTGPLLRVSLLQLAAQEYVLIFTMHHIISDGWSIGILKEEVSALYAAFLHDRPDPLPELPIQYADFASWQRAWLQDAVLEDHLAYWKRKLTGFSPLLELPTDFPRVPRQEMHGKRLYFSLPEELSQAIRNLSQQQSVTTFVTMLAALNVLFFRYTGQTDILIGVPASSRNHNLLKKLIGIFVNTLVLRSDLSGDPPFLQLLHQVHETSTGALAHQDVPFEQVVEMMQPARELANSPLFQVMFAFQNAPRSGLSLPDVEAGFFLRERETTVFDMTLLMWDVDQALQGAVEYDASLFRDDTISRMLAHFQVLLQAIVTTPNVAISRLPLLTSPQREERLSQATVTRVTHPAQTVLDLFVAQARRAPRAIAGISPTDTITYARLDAQANQLARQLRKHGAGPDVLVGLCVNRSCQMLVGLLGILKAGSAYVPLDPDYPQARLSFMVEDSGLSILVTGGNNAADLFPDYAGSLIDLDADWPRIAAESSADLPLALAADNVAYLIYTSGSTGRPKGVMASHRGLSNYVQAACRQFDLQPTDRMLQFASLSFDTAAEEIYPILATGGTIILRTDAMMASARTFLEQCATWKITILDLPTAYWHELVAQLETDPIPLPDHLRLVIIGGESANRERVASWQRAVGDDVRLYNTYGPTEATIVTTWQPLVAADAARPIIPIGQPVDNSQAYILDRWLQPTPAGVVGELYVSGDGLARGYHGRPGLTAERFLPHPYSRRGGERLYRTGDLARYGATGEILFVGRADQQVKVRGYRIELGEVEAVLAGYEGVQGAVAAVMGSGGGARLVGYVVGEGGAAIDRRGLLAYARGRLPAYMLPAVIEQLPAFPTTANGKIDRQALPALSIGAEEKAGPEQMARTPIEESVAGVWAEVLEREWVGVQQNFFELGGHSLLATQVISRLRQLFGVEVSLRRLFETPTVAGVAAAVTAGMGSREAAAGGGIEATKREGVMPASYAQRRIWFLEQLSPGTAAYNIPVALRLEGEVNVAALEHSLDRIVARHEILRTRLVRQGEDLGQIIAARGEVKLVTADWRGVGEEEQARRVQAEAVQPFRLDEGALLRVKLARIDEGAYLLLLTMHHIISDGWSMGILMRELSQLYNGEVGQRPVMLPPLPVQYADFAHWQQRELATGVLAAQLAYWRKQLPVGSGQIATIHDLPRPEVQTFAGRVRRFQLDAALSEGVRQVSRQAGGTLFMTLLAAFKLLLYRLSGQEEISIGTPIANRNRAEIEHLIGFFVNTLVLRTALRSEMSFLELLGAVRETALGAYTHQDLPFDLLVEKLQPRRNLNATPLFQVMFALQNTPGTNNLELAGVQVSGVRAETETAKFDLSLSLAVGGSGIRGRLEYNRDLFSEARVAQIIRQYETVLRHVVAQPRTPLGEVPLLTEAERRQVVETWNETAHAYDEITSVVERVAAQAAAQPERIAVQAGGERLSYGELNRQANQLAHLLRARGVTTETAVAICLERSVAGVVAALAVLKAGGCYVPLDPAYPPRRLRYILRDSRAAVLLTESRLRPEGIAACPVVLLDGAADQDLLSQQPAIDPPGCYAPEQAAYIIYTSGSTGQPKGVTVPHRGLNRLVAWQWRVFGIQATDRATLVASPAFDASVLETWPYLCRGASLHIPDEATRTTPSALIAWLAEQAITIAFLPTPLAEAALALPWPASMALRTLLTGGDKLQHGPPPGLPFALVNNYGPTENSVVSTWTVTPPRTVTPPIGRPVDNSQAYILDRWLQPTPAGVVGELYVSGDGLARGYHGRPGLTAERFLPHPYSRRGGERLYRTGDLARYGATGEILFVGRADQQVKVRGYRIELGEVEAVLAGYEGVQGAVAAVMGSGGGARLVGYVVGEGGAAIDRRGLLAYARGRLPAYMLPAVIEQLPAFPTTANGKIDRQALPALAIADPDPTQSVIGPRDDIELDLVKIWEDVLQIRPIGVNDDYFELGGQSLLAIQIMARIREQWGQSIPLTQLFQDRTIESLSIALRRRNAQPTHDATIVLLQAGDARKTPLFLVHPVGGTVFCYADLLRHLDGRPCYGFQARGVDGPEEPFTQIERMAHTYNLLLQEVQSRGPYQIGGWSMGGVVALEMAQQLQAQGKDVDSLVLIDAHFPADRDARASDDAYLLRQFARHLGLPARSRRQIPAGRDVAEMLLHVLHEARQANLVLPDFTPPQLARRFAVFKANWRALAEYAPQQYGGRVLLCVAEDNEPEEVAGIQRWPQVLKGEVETQYLPGDHFSLVREPDVRRLGAYLVEKLR